MSLGLAHYLLSYIYARSQMTSLAASPQTALPLLAFFGIGAGFYHFEFPLVVFFCIHHVFNETYISTGKSDSGLNSSKHSIDEGIRRLYLFAKLMVHLFFYLCLLRHYAVLNEINANIYLCGFIASYALFTFSLFKMRRSMSTAALIDQGAFEILMPILVFLSSLYKVPFLVIVCYHFIFWCFVPLPKLLEKGRANARNYLLLNAVFTTVFLAISPIGFIPYGMSGSVFFNQFLFWSNLHIATSFALSRSHPGWITRWFYPAPGASSA